MAEEDTDYKALYEQVIGEKEKLQEERATYVFAADSLLDYMSWDGLKQLSHNKYFLWGCLAGAFLTILFVLIYGD